MPSYLNKKKLYDLKRKLSNAIGAVRSLGKEVSLTAVMLCGVLVIAASIAYAASLPTKTLAVVTAAIGSILGTAIVCFMLPRLTQAGVDQHSRDLKITLQREAQLQASIEKVHEAAEQLLERTRTVEKERKELERRIQRLENMRVDANSVRAILRLALLEVDVALKDFYRKELSKKPPPDDLSRHELYEYVGVVEASFKASLGVDLQNVRLREDDENRVVISGLRAEFQGLSDLSENWMLYEVRVRRWGGILSDVYRVLPKDQRVAALTIEQRSSLQRRINSGIDFVNLDAAIKRIAREILAMLLSPLQKEIIFAEDDDQPGMQLMEFLEAHNRQIDLLRGDLDEEKRRLEEQRSRLSEGQYQLPGERP